LRQNEKTRCNDAQPHQTRESVSLKVILVSKALVVGAYQRKLEELARQLGVELVAVVPPLWRDGLFGPATHLQRAHMEGYKLIVAPAHLNGNFHLHYYPTLPRILAEVRPDVLHMDEEPYNLATWLALRAAQRHGVPSLFFSWQNLKRVYPWPFRHFERTNYAIARYAIAGNPTAARVLQQKGYAGTLAVIPQFGVDPTLYSPAPTATTIKRRKVVFGYAGRLVSEKGVDVLLRACAGLRGAAWRLDILGEGPERPRLGALARELGIADRVSFLGQVPSTRAAEYYRDMDVLVLPSLTRPNWVEQFGRILIEAMACGVAVVGSSSGEIPWVIGDAGVIFPEGDVEGLTEVLAGLLADEVRRHDLAQRGRERVLAQFTQTHIAEATVGVYREMLR
jgi:glycosyltransferase involved in cell wall biosynthesis